MEKETTIVFVYNADTGVFNLLSDVARKAFTDNPGTCSLCDLTHDPLSMKKEWKDVVENLPYKTEFLHRNEFQEAYPDHKDTELPAVFLKNESTLALAVPAEKINTAQNLNELKEILNTSIRS